MPRRRPRPEIEHSRDDRHLPPPSRPSSVWTLTSVLLLAAATLYTFWGSLDNDFVNFDDDYLIVRNEHFRGLAGDNLRWMFSSGEFGHYQPLTWISYALDYAVWHEPAEAHRFWGGVSPFGFHLTNVLLHAATAIGFFFVARRLVTAALPDTPTSARLLAALVAALFFAVHPLRVESVAWVTERRDVLSGALLMPSVLLYLRAVGPASGRRIPLLAASLLLYVLSLLSKAGGMTLPLVLLLLDVYPLRRLGPWRQAAPAPAQVAPESGSAAKGLGARTVILEKVSFLVPAVIVAGLALWAQASSGAMRSASEHPIELRLAQAFYGVFFYLWKTIWPEGLIPMYEQRFDVVFYEPVYVGSALFTLVLTAVALGLARRRPGLLIAWLVYLVVLSPVLGFAQSGAQVVADRYSYLAGMSWALLIGGALVAIWRRVPSGPGWSRVAIVTPPLIAIGVLINLSRTQTEYWSDSYSLWQRVINVAPETGTAYANLAAELNRRGDHARAWSTAERALEILPGNVIAQMAIGRAAGHFAEYELSQGNAEQAERLFRISEKYYEDALSRRQDDRAGLISLAGAKRGLGKLGEAEAICRRLVALDPENPVWYLMLTRVLVEAGRVGEAIVVLESGLSRAPADPALNARIAWILSTAQRDDVRDGNRALQHAALALRQGGADPTVHEAYAAALAETGRFRDAAEHLADYLASAQDLLSPQRQAELERQRSRYLDGVPSRD